MKKTFMYFCLLFIVQTAFAADSLYVREQQIPILIDRIDNVLYEMRIPAQKGAKTAGICRFWKNIRLISRAYYGSIS